MFIFDVFRFAHPWAVYIGVPVVIVGAIVRWYYYRQSTLVYPLTSYIALHGAVTNRFRRPLLFALRVFALALCIVLIGQPQIIDRTHTVHVEGVDIIIALDVSDSMRDSYSMRDNHSRLSVAKQEAIAFINKRDNDPVGLVLFGSEAATYCPLTLDKHILTSMITDYQVGEIDENGTVISTALMTAVNRLKDAQAKSKVVILLSDGQETPNDADPRIAVELAKKIGVRAYTIFIGDTMFHHPLFGVQKANTRLLQYIAQETGGTYFEAKDPQQMRTIYDTIDQLEKTEYETDVLSHYYDWFIPLVWIVIGLLLIEALLLGIWWFGL